MKTQLNKEIIEWSKELEEIRNNLPDGHFLVPKYNLETLRELIGKLNKRAIKLECSLITIETVGEHVVSADACKKYLDADGNPKVERYSTKVIISEVRVHGEAPKLNGWSFIGTIQHDHNGDGGNILRVISEYKGNVPQRFRTATPDHCDHCGCNRRRKNTYILLNDLGEWKQIGRTCLKDFLGHRSPEGLASWTETLLNLKEVVFEAWGGGFGREMDALDLAGVILNAATVIRINGWTSKAKAYEWGGTSTADETSWTLGGGWSNHQREEGIRLLNSRNISDAKLAAAALRWAKDIPEDVESDYLYNLRTVAQASYIEWSKLGIAVSMVPAYQRAVRQAEEEERKAKQTPSEWVGNPKERLVLSIKVTGMSTYENDFGGGVVVKMVTDSGSILTWFASNAWQEGLEQKGLVVGGDFIKVKATVKKHEEFRGQKQTVVNRVAVQ